MSTLRSRGSENSDRTCLSGSTRSSIVVSERPGSPSRFVRLSEPTIRIVCGSPGLDLGELVLEPRDRLQLRGDVGEQQQRRDRDRGRDGDDDQHRGGQEAPPERRRLDLRVLLGLAVAGARSGPAAGRGGRPCARRRPRRAASALGPDAGLLGGLGLGGGHRLLGGSPSGSARSSAPRRRARRLALVGGGAPTPRCRRRLGAGAVGGGRSTRRRPGRRRRRGRRARRRPPAPRRGLLGGRLLGPVAGSLADLAADLLLEAGELLGQPEALLLLLLGRIGSAGSASRSRSSSLTGSPPRRRCGRRERVRAKSQRVRR